MRVSSPFDSLASGLFGNFRGFAGAVNTSGVSFVDSRSANERSTLKKILSISGITAWVLAKIMLWYLDCSQLAFISVGHVSSMAPPLI